MKKFLALFLAISFVFLLIACGEQGDPADTTGGTASSPTSVPTDPSSSGSGKTETAQTSSTETSATSGSSAGGQGETVNAGITDIRNLMNPASGIDPREIKFRSFCGYDPALPWSEQKINLKTRWPWRGAYFGKSTVKGYFSGWKEGGTTAWDPLIATVVSYDKLQCQTDESGISYSKYYVTFSSYSGVKPDGIYMMEYVGRADQPYYNRPTLIPGKRYLRLLPAQPSELKSVEGCPIINTSVFFLIEEQNGVEYVYGIDVDLSGMDCAIPITDPYENAVYKPGIDDDIIAHMEEHGIPAPTYDYKCELHAFVKEMNDDID